MKSKVVMVLLLLITSLFIAEIAEAQIACFQYSGGVVSCDGPSGNTTIAPLGTPNQGVITEHGHGRNSLTPYTIIPPASSSPRSRDLNESIRPLDRLDRPSYERDSPYTPTYRNPYTPTDR
jgi:hypothetical protein